MSLSVLHVCSEHLAGPVGELGTHGVGKWGPDPSKGAGSVLRESVNVCVLVNL